MKLFPAVVAFFCLIANSLANEANVDLLEQQAWQTAANEAAKTVVQIQTVGGSYRVGRTLIFQGPTTGVIVSSDGYIVSSAFNFANKPNSILVRLPSGESLPAEVIAQDKNRLLVLLKIEPSSPLPVPQTNSSDDIQVGQWAIALGRTFDDNAVNISTGIISGLNRRYGRVIQTDASISVANYGGPLVDIFGRTMGILVPMAPQGSGSDNEELAGAEFYDSGIGFAVPMTHVVSILDRWKQGNDLLPGKLGVGLTDGPASITPPKISFVWPGSPAANAGWQAGDLIVKVNDQPIETQSHLRFQIVPRYAGDSINVTIRRDKEDISSEIILAGEMPPYRHAFLGVLPDRTEKTEQDQGIKIRTVWPDSSAANIGLKSGDILLSINDQQLKSLEKAFSVLASLQPAEAAKLVVLRDDQQQTFSADLSGLPSQILAANQLGKDEAARLEEQDAALQPLKLATLKLGAKYYDPDPDSENTKGFLLWLGKGDDADDQQLLDTWKSHCQRNHLVLMIAHPGGKAGWTTEDLPQLKMLAEVARRRWKLDSHRTVIGGVEKAGQLAFALAFAERKDFSGVVGIDAPLPRSLQIPTNRPGVRLAVLSIQSENSTFAPLIRNDLQRLDKAGYIASWLVSSAIAHDQATIEPKVIDSISRWIDGLDRF